MVNWIGFMEVREVNQNGKTIVEDSDGIVINMDLATSVAEYVSSYSKDPLIRIRDQEGRQFIVRGKIERLHMMLGGMALVTT